MMKAIRRILRDTCDSFYGYRSVVLEFRDPEDLHQMRVAGRTLLSYFILLADKKDAHRRELSKVRTPLKETMALLGRIRDLDVLMEGLQLRSETMVPEQRALINGLVNRMLVDKVRLREKLAEMMPESIGPGWKDRMDRWIISLEPRRSDEETILDKIAGLRKKKEKAMKAIRAYPKPDMADDEYLAIIHSGRISVKKLRYALNIVKKLGMADKMEIEELKTLQDHLGHINDMRVWSGLLRDQYGASEIVDDILAQWRSEMRDTLVATGLTDCEGKK